MLILISSQGFSRTDAKLDIPTSPSNNTAKDIALSSVLHHRTVMQWPSTHAGLVRLSEATCWPDRLPQTKCAYHMQALPLARILFAAARSTNLTPSTVVALIMQVFRCVLNRCARIQNEP